MPCTIPPYRDVVAFHGHSCPGLAIGYRAAVAALENLQVDRPADEELVAVVENDACGIDAVQYVAGTTLGKGNLILLDYGKRVYTFINRATGEAVRVAELPEFSLRKGDPRLSDLRKKLSSSSATPAEEAEFARRSEAYVRELLSLPEGEMFSVVRVTAEIPEKARIFRSIRCPACGETMAESRAVVVGGKRYCIPCSRKAGQGNP